MKREMIFLTHVDCFIYSGIAVRYSSSDNFKHMMVALQLLLIGIACNGFAMSKCDVLLILLNN